jgi:hypothetical protein
VVQLLSKGVEAACRKAEASAATLSIAHCHGEPNHEQLLICLLPSFHHHPTSIPSGFLLSSIMFFAGVISIARQLLDGIVPAVQSHFPRREFSLQDQNYSTVDIEQAVQSDQVSRIASVQPRLSFD